MGDRAELSDSAADADRAVDTSVDTLRLGLPPASPKPTAGRLGPASPVAGITASGDATCDGDPTAGDGGVEGDGAAQRSTPRCRSGKRRKTDTVAAARGGAGGTSDGSDVSDGSSSTGGAAARVAGEAAPKLHVTCAKFKSLARWSFPQLKAAAQAENFHPDWQTVTSKQHKKDLVAGLRRARRDVDSFVKTVKAREGADACSAAAIEELEEDGERVKPDVVESAMKACVHFVPSGSGVHVGDGVILTAAHCVSADGDPDESDDEDDVPPPDRVGRWKRLITADGVVALARCFYSDEGGDVALLRLCADAGEASLGSLPLAATEPPARRHHPRVICIGNPFDGDLEGPENAKLKKMGFLPFTVSAGVLKGRLGAQRNSDTKHLGGQIHSCWTYWGHSGAPIVDGYGNIVALHNSWDDRNGNRHGVEWKLLRKALDAAGIA